jgi:hypothetical protein
VSLACVHEPGWISLAPQTVLHIRQCLALTPQDDDRSVFRSETILIFQLNTPRTGDMRGCQRRHQFPYPKMIDIYLSTWLLRRTRGAQARIMGAGTRLWGRFIAGRDP